MWLTSNETEAFHREGYLVVDGVFADEDLQPAIDEICAAIDERVPKLVEEGKLSRTYKEEGFETRLSRITAETDELYWAICSGQLSGPGIFSVLTHPKLLDLVESLLGADIIASSAYRLRPKVPGFGHGVVPWHQDSGYFEPFCDNDLILTVWIPLVDATLERGCLHVLPRMHTGDVAEHVQGHQYLAIPEADLPVDEMVATPVKKGGVLLLTNRTPHCSTPNTTDVIRWSLDLRYQNAALPTNYTTDDGAPFREPVSDREPVACYPPEADFLVRSSSRPDAVVRDWKRFDDLRKRYERQPMTARWT